MELDGKAIKFAEVKRTRRGRDQIHIWTDADVVHAVAPEALASWSELLGYAEPAEALEAILEAAVERSEPPIDPDTGEGVWSDAYELLEIREVAREAEVARANEEGRRDDPRSPRLRGTVAAHKAVHESIDGGECAMDRCRRVARERMNLPEPSNKCGADSRNLNPASRMARAASLLGGGVDEDRHKLQALAGALADKIHPDTEAFLHWVSRNGPNPLVDGSGTDGVRRPEWYEARRAELIRKYARGDRAETHPDVDAQDPDEEVPYVQLGVHPQRDGGAS